MAVGIVGAGITGLAVLYHLRERDVDAVVLEAEMEPGGVVRTIEREGRVLDLGPQRTRLTPGVSDLVTATGLEEQVIEANDVPLYVYHDGDLAAVPLSVPAAFTTDLLSVGGKLRAVLEPLTGPAHPGESVHEFLSRTFGREVADRVGGPLYAGLYASDPAAMPVEHSLARALEQLGVGRSVLLAAVRSRLRGRDPPPAVSFASGMAALPRALASRYADDVYLERPVEAIVRSGDGRYRLRTTGGDVTVEHVVLTVPAPVAGELLRSMDVESADALSALRYNPLAVVHLSAPTALDGAGHQVARGEDLVTRGVTWNASLLDRDGVYTCYLGGMGSEHVLSWDDDRLGTVAASEFETATGVAARPLAVHRVEPGMPAYDGSWDELEHVDPPSGVTLCANYESRAGIPGRVRQAEALTEELAAELGVQQPPETASPAPASR